MKSFKDFGIEPQTKGFEGDKIKIDRILNKEIIVKRHRIDTSKYKDKSNGRCLVLEIEVDGQNRIVFTGSTVLQELIQKVPESGFPFRTKIVKDNERFEFT